MIIVFGLTFRDTIVLTFRDSAAKIFGVRILKFATLDFMTTWKYHLALDDAQEFQISLWKFLFSGSRSSRIFKSFRSLWLFKPICNERLLELLEKVGPFVQKESQEPSKFVHATCSKSTCRPPQSTTAVDHLSRSNCHKHLLQNSMRASLIWNHKRFPKNHKRSTRIIQNSNGYETLIWLSRLKSAVHGNKSLLIRKFWVETLRLS